MQPGISPIWLGPLLMIAAMACFVALDAALKHLVQRYDGLFLAWGRCLVQVLLLAVLAPVLGAGRVLTTRRPLLQLGRGVTVAISSICMIVASRYMQLTEIYTIAFAAPLLAALLARGFLGEPVTARQWGLIALGFMGVLVAIGPALPAFGLLMALPLLQAGSNASYHVLTRVGAQDEPAYAQLFYSGLFACLLLSLLLPWTWTVLPLADWALLIAGSALVTLGHFMLTQAFALAPTAHVSPMVYFQVVWSTLAGWLVFGDLPGVATTVGASIVVASGIALIRSRV